MTSTRTPPAQLKHRRSYFYSVPWCVPPWSWQEFGITWKCLLRGEIVNGPSPMELASAIKDWLGVKFCLPVNRGRTAIELALRAQELKPGDEVVLPSYVCQSVLDGVIAAGVSPVFADIGPNLNVTAETLRDALTPNTRCVIVPHLFGKAAPIDQIETMLSGTGITIIDDAAQSFGARRAGRPVGTFGACGIVSCGPGKSLAGAAGGLLVTNDVALFEKAAAIGLGREKTSQVASRTLAFWIWRRFRGLTLPVRVLLDRFRGPEADLTDHVNAPLSNLDAAIMLAQLQSLERNTKARRDHSALLLTSLGDTSQRAIANLSVDDMALKLVLVLPDYGPRAAQCVDLFGEAGIECEVGYQPLHFRRVTTISSTVLEVTESLWERVLCIPLERALKDTLRLERASQALIAIGSAHESDQHSGVADNDLRFRPRRSPAHRKASSTKLGK